MDQLRKMLGWLKRQHFWVLAVVLTSIALGCWYRAAGALQDEFAKNQRTIKQEFDAQSRLRREAFHANEGINQQQRKEIKEQSESVAEIWQQLYDRQREEILKWPDELSQRFRDYVAKLKFGEEIPIDLRNNYMNYVGGHFNKLPERVKARVLSEGEGGRRGRGGSRRSMPYEGRASDRGTRGMYPGAEGPGGAEVAPEQDYIVEWLDQDTVRDELYMAQTPTSLRIWVTQEDIWVYHTLLQIIANTNEAAGADRNSNAAVREIEYLEVGRPAAEASRSVGRIELLAPPDAGGTETEGGVPGARMGMGRMMPRDDMGGEASRGMMRGRGGTTGEEDDAALVSSRYLDAEGNPITVPSGPFDASVLGQEYKRLPIRMSLVMDQRWLSHLISECANAPLQVEVQQVRINPTDEGGGRSGYSGLRGRSRGRSRGVPMESRRSGSRSGAMVFPQDPSVQRIVIQGMIYIFNQPDTSVLQVDEPQA